MKMDKGKQYDIGIMSGTSMDGIDCVIAEFQPNRVKLIATQSFNYPSAIKTSIQKIYAAGYVTSLNTLGVIDYQLGEVYAKCVLELLKSSGIPKGHIRLIACHGQTVLHAPKGKHPFSLQLGNADVIAVKTGIDTLNNFRNKDMVSGGEGAPLAPLFHQQFLGQKGAKGVILNLGGIANITCLSPEKKPFGFDTGPANVLIDLWIQKHQQLPFDASGCWGESGKLIPRLLDKLLSHCYFQKPPPKSTDVASFNLNWLMTLLSGDERPEDVQHTLHAFTAKSVANAIQTYHKSTQYLRACGGGAYNRLLLKRLQQDLPEVDIQTTEDAGIAPKWVEAACFAWLGFCYRHNIALDYSTITGARKAHILGTLHLA